MEQCIPTPPDGQRLANYAWLDDYFLAKPGTVRDFKVEWGWYRYQVGGKMFAAICGFDQPDSRPFTTLKCEPLKGDFLREQYPGEVFPGYYMNKVHWNSAYLDSVPREVIFEMADESYRLIFGSLTKKMQKEISGAE